MRNIIILTLWYIVSFVISLFLITFYAFFNAGRAFIYEYKATCKDSFEEWKIQTERIRKLCK